jgi:hypothetical protein
VLFGHRRIPGTIVDLLPVSDTYVGRVATFGGDKEATQIARVRFKAGASLPALNSTVYIHMHYTRLSARIADWLVKILGRD